MARREFDDSEPDWVGSLPADATKEWRERNIVTGGCPPPKKNGETAMTSILLGEEDEV